ncbi:MAG TPA: DNA polymerase III subunit delta, partial [Candidatus Acidoferrales bacterium]|nr:DNA polymerase III subunit delta [Candidatus Acidoferrales bacterium]
MSAAKSVSPLAFICGNDEFTVKKRAKEIFQAWAAESGSMDQEIIDAAVSNSGDALNAIAKLREAIQTLPFFGSSKIVWLRDCSFLGEERAASAQAVADTLADLAAELKSFKWDNVRLLISAGKVDRRKTFFKTLEKIGSVENFEALSADDRDWAERAEGIARGAVRRRGKEVTEEALAELVARVGPNAQQLENEAEKLALFVGGRQTIEFNDVASVCSRNKTARAFALGDALGDRDLPRLLKRLDEELWEMKFDSQRSPIGLLYGLISKVRAMLMLKEMLREGWVKPETDYNRFKAQLARVPAERLPADKRFNPLALNPYVLFRALPQAKRYSREELVRAMDLLLRCNRRLVTSGLDKAFMLQQIVVEIAAPQA